MDMDTNSKNDRQSQRSSKHYEEWKNDTQRSNVAVYLARMGRHTCWSVGNTMLGPKEKPGMLRKFIDRLAPEEWKEQDDGIIETACCFLIVFQMMLMVSFIVMFVLSYQSVEEEKYLSLEKIDTTYSICRDVLNTVSDTYELDDNGYWSTRTRWAFAETMLAVVFRGFAHSLDNYRVTYAPKLYETFRAWNDVYETIPIAETLASLVIKDQPVILSTTKGSPDLYARTVASPVSLMDAAYYDISGLNGCTENTDDDPEKPGCVAVADYESSQEYFTVVSSNWRTVFPNWNYMESDDNTKAQEAIDPASEPVYMKINKYSLWVASAVNMGVLNVTCKPWIPSDQQQCLTSLTSSSFFDDDDGNLDDDASRNFYDDDFFQNGDFQDDYFVYDDHFTHNNYYYSSYEDWDDGHDDNNYDYDDVHAADDMVDDFASSHCPATCYGYTCDYWDSIYGQNPFFCDTNGNSLSDCDCSGCACDGENTDDTTSCDTCDQFELTMIDSYGDGWNGASYTLTGNTVTRGGTLQSGNGATVIFTGEQRSSSPGNTYTFSVSAGEYPSEVSWNLMCTDTNQAFNGTYPPNSLTFSVSGGRRLEDEPSDATEQAQAQQAQVQAQAQDFAGRKVNQEVFSQAALAHLAGSLLQHEDKQVRERVAAVFDRVRSSGSYLTRKRQTNAQAQQAESQFVAPDEQEAGEPQNEEKQKQKVSEIVRALKQVLDQQVLVKALNDARKHALGAVQTQAQTKAPKRAQAQSNTGRASGSGKLRAASSRDGAQKPAGRQARRLLAAPTPAPTSAFDQNVNEYLGPTDKYVLRKYYKEMDPITCSKQHNYCWVRVGGDDSNDFGASLFPLMQHKEAACQTCPFVASPLNPSVTEDTCNAVNLEFLMLFNASNPSATSYQPYTRGDHFSLGNGGGLELDGALYLNLYGGIDFLNQYYYPLPEKIHCARPVGIGKVGNPALDMERGCGTTKAAKLIKKDKNSAQKKYCYDPPEELQALFFECSYRVAACLSTALSEAYSFQGSLSAMFTVALVGIVYVLKKPKHFTDEELLEGEKEVGADELTSTNPLSEESRNSLRGVELPVVGITGGVTPVDSQALERDMQKLRNEVSGLQDVLGEADQTMESVRRDVGVSVEKQRMELLEHRAVVERQAAQMEAQQNRIEELAQLIQSLSVQQPKSRAHK